MPLCYTVILFSAKTFCSNYTFCVGDLIFIGKTRGGLCQQFWTLWQERISLLDSGAGHPRGEMAGFIKDIKGATLIIVVSSLF